MRPYGIFISHAWKRDEDFIRLVDILDRANKFKWQNHSVTEHDPLIDADSKEGIPKLIKQLEQQIRPAHCVLVFASLFEIHGTWVKREIKIAQQFQKPILGIAPWGKQRTPTELFSVVKAIVGWTSTSLVREIRKYSL